MPGEAKVVNVTGLATVKVGPVNATSDNIEDLGYTRNGIELSFQGFFLDVPGDENGGDDGPPVDVQYMGEIATIRMELTKYNSTVAEKVSARVNGGSAGVPVAAGTLMFGDNNVLANEVAWRLLIQVSSGVGNMNFLRAFPRNVIELNKGTRFSTLVAEFEAHKNAAGVLWNTSTA